MTLFLMANSGMNFHISSPHIVVLLGLSGMRYFPSDRDAVGILLSQASSLGRRIMRRQHVWMLLAKSEKQMFFMVFLLFCKKLSTAMV